MADPSASDVVPDHDDDCSDWIECWNCGGEGMIEDDDWQWAGTFYRCDICEGKGGWNPEHTP